MLKIFDPRGIRNNNPGNIRLSKEVWQGQSSEQDDGVFVEFTQPLYGLRALMKTLLTYYHKYGLDTVQSLINRYAPPHENATDLYIYEVSKRLGVKRTQKIDVTARETLLTLAQAIVLRENGTPPKDRPPLWYDAGLYDQAAALALPEPVS
jgi:hypothetical protein